MDIKLTHTHTVWDLDFYGQGADCHEIVFSGSRDECSEFASKHSPTRFYIQPLGDIEE